MNDLTVLDAVTKIKNRDIKISELVEHYIKNISDSDLNAFISLNEKAIDKAHELDKQNDRNGLLFGVPIAVKDIFSTRGIKTTAASNMLREYTPVYESTVTKKILDQDAIIIGKTNLDSFCRGSSTATSDFGVVKNPHDKTKVPGGSSGGSAVAVASDLSCAALGTETAGSIRQPASWTGIVGLKPTYGRVSRFGVLAMGSSLDSPGPMTKNVIDSAYLLSIIAGHDSNDFTSAKIDVPKYHEILNKNIKGLKIGVPKQFMEIDLIPSVRKQVEEAIKIFENLGAVISYIDLLNPQFSVSVYTLVCRSEVSSNLSRYDGTRYGVKTDVKTNIVENFEDVRGNGFTQEPKRRIMTGTFALSSGYSDKYYRKAQQVRELISSDFKRAFSEVDIIFGPTTPTTALTPSDALSNPLFGEMMDVLTEASSLTGTPGISIPFGSDNGLPIGIQFMGKHFDEQTILNTAYAFEQEVKNGK